MDNYNLPKFFTGEELKENLTILPDYKKEYRKLSLEERLFMLNSLYDIYIPNNMSFEIYSKLYMALTRSLSKKFTKDSIIQKNENYKLIKRTHSNGLIGGSDSLLITGVSGIGKSSSILNAIELLSNKIIETKTTKIIPAFVLQCPFDCSVKSMLLEILRNVDSILETTYYKFALNSNATIDMLIGMVSQVALNHIGILIIDEIQNVVENKKGKNLVGALTQLINNSGSSIVMVGTPESNLFFEQEEFLARRAIGLSFNEIEYGKEFIDFVNQVFKYNFCKEETVFEDYLYTFIYEHTKGLPSNIITLFHDCQEIAITRGIEKVNLETLSLSYKERMSTLHYYISKEIKPIKTVKKISNEVIPKKVKKVSNPLFKFTDIVKKDGDIITNLRNYIEVLEV